MNELRAPVTGWHRLVHLAIWAVVGILIASLVLPPILGILMVVPGASD
jgi:hypothetical protein